MLELGVGFTFVERQKRMIINGQDFYLDLLFYHRKLKRLVAEYWTELPPKELLEKKLHEALLAAQERIQKQTLLHSPLSS